MSDALRFDRFELQPLERRLLADGRVAPLGSRAFDLLLVLVASGGELLTKDELLRRVWPDTVVEESNLAVQVSALRKVLGSNAIATIPGRGYRFTLKIQGSVALQAPAPPTVLVRPFDNLSPDPADAFIADGLSANVTSTLATVPGMSVIARHSALGSRDAAAEVTEIGRAQGATHVLAGAVAKRGDRMRVNVQLLEAQTGRLLWSERFDRLLREVFEVEDEITLRTVVALQMRLVEGEQARHRCSPTGNFEAWSLATRGYIAIERTGPQSLAEARRLFERAIALEPGYAYARSFLGAVHFLEGRFGFSADPEQSLAQAYEEARQAVQLDPMLPDAHATLGSVLLARREFDAAVASGRQSVLLGPGSAEVHSILAQTLMAVGQWEEALAMSRRAVQLCPQHPTWYLNAQILSLIFCGRQHEAIEVAKRVIATADSPFNRIIGLFGAAFALVELGRVDEARPYVAEAVAVAPGRGASHLWRASLFRHPEHARRFIDALVSAGLPAD